MESNAGISLNSSLVQVPCCTCKIAEKPKNEGNFQNLLVEQGEAVGERAYHLTPVPHILFQVYAHSNAIPSQNFAGFSGGVKLLMTIHMSLLIIVLGEQRAKADSS